ncbi:transketolase-like protein 2 isoform X2 [Latimeria chalumnae]|uniref:transketolase-like protein 2 isoform X2 n=1 Tax=Latimeria chalumnae TaxID=7897 RepID=UPI00313B031C
MAVYHKPDEETLQRLQDTANRLRIHSIRATCASNSGHPTSCCSAAEIMAVLFFNTMKYKPQDPRNVNNDRFVLSKGHAAPILYAAWAEAGYIKEADLLNLRKIDSDLEGHPTPKLSFVDIATGSLGQGLGAACGMAYTGKYFDKASFRVFCLLGDGESSEGAVWEAMAFASYYKLDNLVAIFDVNRLGQSEAAPLQHKTEIYRKRCEAFGWNTYVHDGHSVEELCKAFWEAAQVKDRPTAIIAKTFKGKGIPDVEDKDNWHGKPIPKDKVESVLGTIQGRIKSSKLLCPELPAEDAPQVDITGIKMPSPPAYKLGSKVSVAMGCATRDRTVVFVSTFAAFLSRAYDQIRMGAISQSNINLSGSHCGVSIGEDGPSQMALEDLAMFRAIPTCTVFYPSDGVSTEHAVELAANTKGICFIRTSRPETPVIYPAEEKFEVGQAKVIRQSKTDRVTVIGAGVTLHEALTAAEELAKEGINIRVIDPFTIKPLDRATILASARATGGHVITVEDHYREGGIGEAVSAALAEKPKITVHRLAVSGIPRSGKPTELLDLFGISAKCIIAAVKSTFAN